MAVEVIGGCELDAALIDVTNSDLYIGEAKTVGGGTRTRLVYNGSKIQ